MATQYTSILKLALPVQGELSGTWGDVVNDNITSMVEEAIAGRAVINTWTANAHTLTTANGTTSESRCAMLEFTDTGAALTGAGEVICPAQTKIYIAKNASGQAITVKTSAGTGIAVQNGETKFVFCDGTNVVEAVTSMTTLKVGTGVQVSTILDEDNMASDSATALATQQSIKAYVDSQVTAQDLDFAGDTGTGAVDLDSQSLTVAGTANEIETSASGQTLTVGLPSAIIVTTSVTTPTVQTTNLNANDGTAAVTIADATGQTTINDAVLTTADINAGTIDNTTIGGTTAAAGSFTTVNASGNITSQGQVITNTINEQTATSGVTVDGVLLKDGGATLTGALDVQSTVTADGLTVSNSSANADIVLTEGGTNTDARIRNSNGILQIGSDINNEFGASEIQFSVDGKEFLTVDRTGDISFYEDTGTTPKFFWDASAESLGIGTTSPAQPLTIQATTPIIQLVDSNLSTRVANIGGENGNVTIDIDPAQTAAASFFSVDIDNSEVMRVDQFGNVGIGESAPQVRLDARDSIVTSTSGIAADSILWVTNESSNANAASRITLRTTQTDAGRERAVLEAGLEGTSGGYLSIYTRPTGTAITEKMRITGAGDVGIGTSSPASALDVAGTVTADGLDVDGIVTITDGNVRFDLMESDTTDLNGRLQNTGGILQIRTLNDAKTSAKNRIDINHSTGDISFYEDTGVTPKFFWDASAEALGIGTSSPSGLLTLNNSSASAQLYIRSGDTNDSAIIFGRQNDIATGSIGYYHSDDSLRFNGYNNQERMRITSTGSVGIGTTSPASALDVAGTVTADGLTVDGNATISSASPTLVLEDTDGAAQDDARLQVGASIFNIKRDSDSATRFSIGLTTGDISFYEDTGTTAKFFWDASAESLGIGTDAPTGDLDIYRATSDPDIRLTRATTQSRIATNSAGGLRLQADYGNTAADSFIQFSIDGSEVARFNSDGKLGIGTTSPSAKLQVAGDMILERTDTQSETRNLYIGGARNAAGNDFAAILFRNYDSNGGSVDYVGASITAQPDGAGTDGGLLTFSVSSTTADLFEAMRIDAGGNVLVNKTAANASDQGIQLNADGSIYAKGTTGTGTPLDVRRSTGDGVGNIANFRYGNTVYGSIGATSGGDAYYTGGANDSGIFTGLSAVKPWKAGAAADNTVNLGSSGSRWSTVYAGTGSINTSDANEKENIAALSAAELQAAKVISGLFKSFQFKDAIAVKGSSARTHTGVIAQDVQQALIDAGLDASKYAFFCSDTWWEAPSVVPAVEAELDAEGNVINEAIPERTVTRTYETAEEAPEGATQRTRLGVRYEELLSFIGAATEQRLTSIEARLTALETN